MRKYVSGDAYKIGKVLVKRTRVDGTNWWGWIGPMRVRMEGDVTDEVVVDRVWERYNTDWRTYEWWQEPIDHVG